MVADRSNHPSMAREAAEALIARHIMPLPVPYGRKDPSNRKGWQSERYTAGDLSAFDIDLLNVGMMLGHIVGKDGELLTDRFVDIDLDCREAVICAPHFLPPTHMRWGRDGNPNSHWGYRVTSPEGVRADGSFNDPTQPKTQSGKSDARICEIRWTGQQSIAPGSMWTSEDDAHRERVRWEPDGDGEPEEVMFEILQKAVRAMYAAALVARYWKEGIRHSAALPLSGMLCYGGLELPAIEQFIQAVGAASGETPAEIDNRLGCARDTFQKMLQGLPYTGAPTLEDYIPRAVVVKVRRSLGLRVKGAQASDIGPDGLFLTDLGNAERFAVAYEGKVLWCDVEQCWYIYENGVWKVDKRRRVVEMERELIHDWRAKLNSGTFSTVGSAPIEVCRKWASKWESDKSITACLNLVKSFLPVAPEDFDADPNILNVKNGTVILGDDGSHYRREPRWQDLCTSQWNANYDPEATHPDLEWYRNTFVPERDRWEYIEEALGYSLLGRGKRNSFQLLGPSNSGKSMLLAMIKRGSGSYGVALKYESMLADPHGGGGKPRSDLLSLRGARFVTIAEVGHGAVWDSALFKTMTSQTDEYEVRGTYAKWGQTFRFTCALWTSGNQPYGGDAGDDALYQRVRVIRFDHPMPVADRNEQREEEIIDPARTGDAFLAMCLRGYARLFTPVEAGGKGGKLIPPDSVQKSTEEVRDKLDRWADVIAKLFNLTHDPDDGVIASEAWEQAREKLVESGEHIRSVTKSKLDFENAMERRGLSTSQASNRFGNKRYWRGVSWVANLPYGVTPPNWKDQASGENPGPNWLDQALGGISSEGSEQ